MKRSDFNKVYANYLQSEEWKDRRHLVMLRDNEVCQACLSAKATEVHHLTYERVFNEPLFDLRAICHECHSMIHDKRTDIERAQRYIPQGITLKTYSKARKAVVSSSGPSPIPEDQKGDWKEGVAIYHPDHGQGRVEKMFMNNGHLVLEAVFENGKVGRFLPMFTVLGKNEEDYRKVVILEKEKTDDLAELIKIMRSRQEQSSLLKGVTL